MARKTKAQEKEPESPSTDEKKTEEEQTEETEENNVVESADEEKPESTAGSNDSNATEPETTNETATKETSSETTSSPPATQTPTIERPPSTGRKFKFRQFLHQFSVIASHLPNTLIDSTLKFFVGGLHPNTDETELSNYFAKYGQILSTQVMRDLTTGRHRGFGFVTLKVQHNSMNVFKDSHTVTGKRVDVRAMQTDLAASLRKKIFVGGLSKALNEEMLDEYFSKFGEVDKVTIMRQLDGTSRGFGFIVFTTEEAATASLRNPTHFVYGNKVDVRAAETRPRQSGHHSSNALYPYGMMQAPADMYAAAAGPMYRPQGAYDPAQYANMTQQQMVQHQYPQYQLLQQQMLQQQMSMAGTYGGYYSSSSQQPAPAATTNPSGYTGTSVSYGAYRGREGSYQGAPGSDPSSRGYRQQPY
ncbi:uncharacterized protein TOT_040000162 [Theileria orientalis strain Shintoku]|uniref:RRM domain-containing protein n=1 Tax=Theileria orientalis strain Shintoku TaxID=869250 RepID=J4DA53_THEOR|nr:uncharacterized protein TOT_040000162 [Theileria orientalis strain Shintoku]BAM41780.1 uncharacterized protein TOT_040000162 [Theileria orientalis strain Shintoku]|eukprot:XP_009692081.1 uncharacterized protein TOT_040000162 [Theileria orientalis strain Shintoku]